MTTPASNPAFPYFLGASTANLMQDFDTDVYNTSSSSLIYKIVDTLCGSTGAGQLLNQNFLNVLQGDLATTYGSDLDYFFGNVGFLPRAPSEQYTLNAATDLATSDEWDQVDIADAHYRARIQNFWAACGMGGTSEAIRLATMAACSCDANIYEVWWYIDDDGLTEPLGRADARNEVVVQPLKSSLTPEELKLLRDMLDRLMPMETIVTINVDGLEVLTPIGTNSVCASSVYFEVEQVITATPVIKMLPPANQLPLKPPSPSWLWLFDADDDNPRRAPYARHNKTAHHTIHYLVGGGARSPINSVTYGTINPPAGVSPSDYMDYYVTAPNFVAFQTDAQYTPFAVWALADSPDNFPGGKFGQHPSYSPALNADGTPYSFPWPSQTAYVTAQITIVTNLGGIATETGFQLPVAAPNQTQLAFLPEYAVAYFPPGRDSTVSASLTVNRQVNISGSQGWVDTTGFIRS